MATTSDEFHSTKRFLFKTDDIQRQLESVLASAEFHATNAQRDFLRFVIEQTLAGKADEIKGFTVATEVFGRREDFDQATDPIVSIQANKLRRALERYYLVAGTNDPIRIDIPKGTYVPTFRKQHEPGSQEKTSCAEGSETEPAVFPSLLIQPFQNLTGDPAHNSLAASLTTHLSIELGSFPEISIVMASPREGKDLLWNDDAPRFVLNGSVMKDNRGLKTAMHLNDRVTGRQIWGDVYRSDSEFDHTIIEVAAVKISGEHGAIPRFLFQKSIKKPLDRLTTYEAILRYYDYDKQMSFETMHRAQEALELVRRNDPNCGVIWTMLARIYGDRIAFGLADSAPPLEKVLAFAEKGVSLHPENPRAWLILAFDRFLDNDISAAREEIERAYSVHPDSLFFSDAIGYLFTLLGEWERGHALIMKAIKDNPYHRNFVYYALWLNLFRQKKYKEALRQTQNFRMTGNFWDPLCQATNLGHLGRIAEGKAAASKLLKLTPQFLTHGRDIIENFIKSKDIVDRVIAGLRKVDVPVA